MDWILLFQATLLLKATLTKTSTTQYLTLCVGMISEFLFSIAVTTKHLVAVPTWDRSEVDSMVSTGMMLSTGWLNKMRTSLIQTDLRLSLGGIMVSKH